jgi:F0F1-type ATP synthase membrane subunit b/b'
VHRSACDLREDGHEQVRSHRGVRPIAKQSKTKQELAEELRDQASKVRVNGINKGSSAQKDANDVAKGLDKIADDLDK